MFKIFRITAVRLKSGLSVAQLHWLCKRNSYFWAWQSVEHVTCSRTNLRWPGLARIDPDWLGSSSPKKVRPNWPKIFQPVMPGQAHWQQLASCRAMVARMRPTMFSGAARRWHHTHGSQAACPDTPDRCEPGSCVQVRTSQN